jgi:hypothetical protein
MGGILSGKKAVYHGLLEYIDDVMYEACGQEKVEKGVDGTDEYLKRDKGFSRRIIPHICI